MGNTESITIGDASEKAGHRSRNILRKKSYTAGEEDPHSKNEVEIVKTSAGENEQSPDCPHLSTEDRQIIIRTWAKVEEHIAQVGLCSFLEMFRRAPDSLHVFPFLKHLNHKDREFYAQVVAVSIQKDF